MDFYFQYKKTVQMDGSVTYILDSYYKQPAVFVEKGFEGQGSNIQEFLDLFQLSFEQMQRNSTITKYDVSIADIQNKKGHFQLKIIPLSEDDMLIHLHQISEDAFITIGFQENSEPMSILEVKANKIVYVLNNQAHQMLTGFSKEEIEGRSISDVLGQEYSKTYEQAILQSIETGKPIQFRGKASFNREISERFCRIVPFSFQSRNLILKTEVDTEYIRNWMRDNNLSVTNFDKMFQSNHSIMLIIEPESGKIMNANPAAVEFYGYEKRELIGMPIQQINMLTDEEVKYYRTQALKKDKQYFLFQHRLKSGEVRLVDVNSSPIEINHKHFLFSVITDATSRENNEEELFKEKELQRITMDSIGDCVVTTDNNGLVTYINKATARAIDLTQEQVQGKHFDDIFPMTNEYTQKPIPSIVQMVIDSGEKQELENHTVLHTHNNKLIPIEDSAAPILDKRGNMYGVVVIFRDVSNAKEKKKKIEYLSFHDELTGLYNRRFYYNYMEMMENEDIYPLGFIMGDVNGLKLTNDVFGHTLGDKLLVTVAEAIQLSLDYKCKVIRWGGDEFIIIVPKCNQACLDKIVVTIKNNLSSVSLRDMIEVSVSFGSAIKTDKFESTDKVLKNAEEVMYQIKLLESKSMRGNTINALLTTLDEKSQETKEHTVRLSSVCTRIAKKRSLHAEVVNRLALLAALHDIGKIGIPEHILEKEGPLTPEEWKIMKTHPQIGYRIASNVPDLHVVANEILHHHERFDGTGYPAGLAGEKIPINCRILAVVDAYDAMTNDRIYRKARTHQEAMEELERCSGTQFDPQIVKLFQDLLYLKSVNIV